MSTQGIYWYLGYGLLDWWRHHALITFHAKPMNTICQFLFMNEISQNHTRASFDCSSCSPYIRVTVHIYYITQFCLNHVNTFLFCACFPVAYHYAAWQVQRPIPLKISTRNSNSTDMFSCIWNPDHMRAVYFSTCHNWSVVTRVKLRNNNKNQYVNLWELCEMSPNYELCTKTPMKRAPANKGAFYSDGSFQIPCVTADWFQNRRKWNQVHIALQQTTMPSGYQYLKSTAIHLIKLRSQRWELFSGGFNQQNY